LSTGVQKKIEDEKIDGVHLPLPEMQGEEWYLDSVWGTFERYNNM